MAGFKGYFAHISLENTPNFPPFTRTKKETSSESVGEGSGVSFCLSMLVEGGLYQFYDFYTGIFEPAAIKVHCWSTCVIYMLFLFLGYQLRLPANYTTVPPMYWFRRGLK